MGHRLREKGLGKPGPQERRDGEETSAVLRGGRPWEGREQGLRAWALLAWEGLPARGFRAWGFLAWAYRGVVDIAFRASASVGGACRARAFERWASLDNWDSRDTAWAFPVAWDSLRVCLAPWGSRGWDILAWAFRDSSCPDIVQRRVAVARSGQEAGLQRGLW